MTSDLYIGSTGLAMASVIKSNAGAIMSTVENELLVAFELHSVERIGEIIDAGFDPGSVIRGKLAVDSLIEMYTRSDAFVDCLRLMLDRGAVLRDPAIAPVLLDDADSLRDAIANDRGLLDRRTDLDCAFTPLSGASLLHVAAEYGHLAAARVLVESGADVNARAAINKFGMNGHTPIFHTVNSNNNRAEPVLRLLLEAGALTNVRLDGMVWGSGFDWETTLFDVTPLSYAQLGLLPQVHRRETDIYHNIRVMLEASGRTVPPLENVPNRYLG